MGKIIYSLFTGNRKTVTEDRVIPLYQLIRESIELSNSPFMVILNGEIILRKSFTATIEKDDLVVFYILPLGGSKDPILTLSGLALSAVGFQSGVTSLGVAGLVLASGLLGLPEAPSVDKANQLSAASPTYVLFNNIVRLGQSIPVIYGTHITYPDIVAQPHNSYENNTQYKNYLFCIGQGNYQIDSIRIGDINISQLSGVSSQIIENDAEITLFDPNIVSSNDVVGQALRGTNISVKQGGGYLGEFIANPPKTVTNTIYIDLSAPGGLYDTKNKGEEVGPIFVVEARKLDDFGNYIDSFFEVDRKTFSAASRNILFKTYVFTLRDSARYAIRIKSLEPESTSSSVVDRITWVGLRAKIGGLTRYGNLTLLALSIKTNSNFEYKEKFNCIVTRKLPVWTPSSGWSNPVVTNSIVWAIADIVKSDYGAKFDDSKLNLQNFYDTDNEHKDRGDSFNGVFDRKMSLWESLKLCAKVGRCAVILQGGVLNLIRDKKQTLPVAMFTPRNIVKDSFLISYTTISDDTADGVTLEYVDNRYWITAEISVDANGNTPNNPARLKLFGCTNENQAKREALYIARNNLYRRKTMYLTTELEGYIPTFGDLVSVTHDIIDEFVTGDVIGFDKGVIELSEPVLRDNNVKFYITFKTKKGNSSSSYEVVYVDDFKIRLMGDWSYVIGEIIELKRNSETIELYIGRSQERTHFILGKSKINYGIVKSIKPRGDFTVKLEILSEDDRVHND